MPETTTAVGGYVISKSAAALAGLMGGLSVSFFWQPKRLHQHGKLAAGAIIGGISVASAFSLGGLAANLLGMDFASIDIALGLGFMIGVGCVGVIAWLANFLERREDLDILEVVQEVRNPSKKRKPAPRKQITRKTK